MAETAEENRRYHGTPLRRTTVASAMAETTTDAMENPAVEAKESPLVVVLRFIVDRVARLIASGSNFDRSEWADLLALRATSHELRDALWNELQGVRDSNAGYEERDRYMPSVLKGRTDYPAALESLLFLSHIHAGDADLQHYFQSVVGDSTRYCVAGGFALCKRLQQTKQEEYQSAAADPAQRRQHFWKIPPQPWEHASQECGGPWVPKEPDTIAGDIDVFVKCERNRLPRSYYPRPDHAADPALDTNLARMTEAVDATRHFFQSRGYAVTVDWTHTGSAEADWVSTSNVAFRVDPFTIDELENEIAGWMSELAEGDAGQPEYLLAHLRRLATDGYDLIPAVRRQREWHLAHMAGAAQDGGYKLAMVDLKLVRTHKNRMRETRKINLVGMWHATDNNTPIASIAKDFDLDQCGISLTAGLDSTGLPSYTFNGSEAALEHAREYRRSGKLMMRLTEFSFEPIYPADNDNMRHLTEIVARGEILHPDILQEIRRSSLRFSVNRQMNRIAKYLARGYEWA